MQCINEKEHNPETVFYFIEYPNKESINKLSKEKRESLAKLFNLDKSTKGAIIAYFKENIW